MSIQETLERIYGAGHASGVAERLAEVMQRHQRRGEHGGERGSRFSERDVLLITYGDSLLSSSEPPLATLRGFATRHLGPAVSGIHILPCFPYTSDYGFSISDYTRVDPSLGAWGDVTALSHEFRLMLDFVLNHCSRSHAWFQAFLASTRPFDEFFITQDPAVDLSGVTRPRTSPLLTPFETARGIQHVWTTFSGDQVDLNYANPDVLLAMIDVMLTYVDRGADLLRMDAVGYLWKEPGTSCIHLERTHQVVKLFRQVLDEVAPRVAIVTETNVPHADNVSYFGNGRDEAQMVYQFPLAPLVLHALSTGDASRLSAWASGLSTPSAETTFFNFLASHDGVGVVPARGYLTEHEVQGLADQVTRHGGQVSYKTNPDGSESPYELNATFFDALSDPNEPWATRLERFICSQAIMLALAGVPGVYLHSLFGSHNNQAGYAASGWKRDLNHERLNVASLEAELADPLSEKAQVFARMMRLLAVRRAQPAFHPNAPQRVLALTPGVLAIQRGPHAGQTLFALHSTSAHSAGVTLEALAPSTLVDVLTDQTMGGRRSLTLAPYGVAWLSTP
ncbi:MAG: alpha-amylase family glycosyl hydrolase [Chloroflexota bacterium]